MSIQRIFGGMVWPRNPTNVSAVPIFSTTTLVNSTASGKVGCVIQIPKTGVISKIGWATRSVTTGATVDVRLESVSTTTRDPSGSLWGTNTNGSQVVANGDSNTWFTTTLTAGATVTKGDYVAVVISNPASSFGNFQISSFSDDNSPDFPYCLSNPSGSWTASALVTPILALEYNDGSYERIRGCWPIKDTISTKTVSTSTSPDVVGARFKLPFATRVRGCWIWAGLDGDAVIKVVDSTYVQGSSTGVMATISVNNKVRRTTNASILFYTFTSVANLAKNTYYRLVIEPSTSTSLTTFTFNVASAALFDAYAGADFHYTTAKDPTQDSDWTNSSTEIPFVGLFIDALDAGQEQLSF